MSINHHLQAKIATDSILEKFKSGVWTCCGTAGKDFYRIGCDSNFPSPDAAFYDDAEDLLTAFEFKPPTENKRGILTGLGQSIAYLTNSNLSFLVVPRKLEDYPVGEYVRDLFQATIKTLLPVGLIVYENDDASKVELVHNVDTTGIKKTFKALANGRFWAKYVDLPVPLFHLYLHYYYLKKIGQINGDAFAACWQERMAPAQILKTLKPVPILDITNEPIKTPAGTKNQMYCEKRLNKILKLAGKKRTDELERLRADIDVTTPGDTYFSSIRKNITFLKHVGVIDSVGAAGSLTDEGFKLYHLGLVNGPNSKLFRDYFTRLVLLTGHHLELIFDLDNLCNQFRGISTISEIKSFLLNDYESRGMIKRNPGRVAGAASKTGFLKDEFILWRSLDLIVPAAGTPDVSFNWKRITEICTLPAI